MATTNFTDGVTPVIAEWLNDVDAHTYDQLGGAHIAAHITNTPAGTIAATDVQAAINELNTDATDHLNDTLGAHAASAISVLDTGLLLTATEVEGALAEIQTNVNNHVNDTTAAHAASAISIVDAGAHYTATDVEGALQELMSSAVYGAFVPTLTAGLNTTSVTDAGCRYSKVGKYVTISGTLYLDPIATGQTDFTMTVPFSFTDALGTPYTVSGVVCGIDYDTSGVLFSGPSTSGVIISVRAFVTNTALQLITFTGSYIAD